MYLACTGVVLGARGETRKERKIARVPRKHLFSFPLILPFLLLPRIAIYLQLLYSPWCFFQMFLTFISGHETTASLLSFCILELGDHPDIVERLVVP